MGIIPSKVLIAGYYKEWCSKVSGILIKKEFPKTQLVFLRGDFNLSKLIDFIKLGRAERIKIFKKRAAIKASFREDRKSLDAKRKPLSKKLLR